jgi:hypothetical protein
MDSLILLLEILSVAGIAVLGLMARRYLPAYVAEKGKNLATKEDIEEITRIIEGVRSQSAAQLELVRSALQHTSQWQSSLAETERNAIVDFFDDCVDLIFGKVQENLGEFPLDNGKSLVNYQTSVRDLVVTLFRKYHRLILYLRPDSEIGAAAEKFVRASAGFDAAFKKHFGRVKAALIEEGLAAQKTDRGEYRDAVSATNSAAKTYQSTIEPFTSEMSESLRSLMVAVNKHLRTGARSAGFAALEEAVRNAAKEPAPLVRG